MSGCEQTCSSYPNSATFSVDFVRLIVNCQPRIKTGPGFLRNIISADYSEVRSTFQKISRNRCFRAVLSVFWRTSVWDSVWNSVWNTSQAAINKLTNKRVTHFWNFETAIKFTRIYQRSCPKTASANRRTLTPFAPNRFFSFFVKIFRSQQIQGGFAKNVTKIIESG